MLISLHHQNVLAPILGSDLGLPEAMLREVLALPMVTLSEDLKVLLREMVRVGTLAEVKAGSEDLVEGSIGEPEDPATGLDWGVFAGVHLVNLAAECVRKEGPVSQLWDTVVEFIGLPGDELKSWLGDYLERGLWEVLFSACQRSPSALLALLEDSSLAEPVRIAALNAYAQVAWHFPLFRGEVLAGMKAVVELIVAGGELPGSALVNELVREAIDLRATSLLDSIAALYAVKLAPGALPLPFSKVKADMEGPVRNYAKRPDESLLERYDRFRSQSRLSAPEQAATAVHLDIPKAPRPGRGQMRSRSHKKQPLRKGKKVGRNQLCPCGSGKKYKHCCGR